MTRRPPKTSKALPASVNAVLFAQLAVMEDAGMAAVDAFKTIAQAPTDVGAGVDKEVGERSRRAALTLAKGRALPDAGFAAGIFSIPIDGWRNAMSDLIPAADGSVVSA